MRAAERAEAVEYVPYHMRDDDAFTVLGALSEHSGLGHTTGHDINTSPVYLVFRDGKVPASQEIPQRRGGVKYIVNPTSDCLILRCGGLHPTGPLLAGELQEPLDPSSAAKALFKLFAREMLRGFTRVRNYWVGPEALTGFRAGQRLATIGIRSPSKYDLAED